MALTGVRAAGPSLRKAVRTRVAGPAAKVRRKPERRGCPPEGGAEGKRSDESSAEMTVLLALRIERLALRSVGKKDFEFGTLNGSSYGGPVFNTPDLPNPSQPQLTSPKPITS